MTIQEWLSVNTAALKHAGIATDRLDCLVLLEDAIGHDRSQILAHQDDSIPEAHLAALSESIKRRISHEPLAYIRGHCEFYGRRFRVSRDVLIPRPETETFIEHVRRLDLPDGHVVTDIGTGSGALAVTVACEIASLRVIATDVDPACLSLAQLNAAAYGASVTFVHGSLLEPFMSGAEHADIHAGTLLCNLPYVPDTYDVNRAAQHEPGLALYGGEDGLDLYRTLFMQVGQLKQLPTYILCESLPMQHADLQKIAAAQSYSLQTTDDFIQVFTRS